MHRVEPRPRSRRRLLLLAAVAAAALAAPLAYAAVRNDIFTDVPSTAADHDAINRVYQAGIMNPCNTSPMQFCPNNTTLRRGIAKQYDYALGLSGTAGKFTPTFNGVNLKGAPLTTDSTSHVANLNGDYLDGLDSSKFARSSTVTWHYIGAAGEPAFENGWTNYDAQADPNAAQYQHVAYAKDQFGEVYLNGLVKGGTIGQRMFQLPLDYCPWFYHAYAVLSANALARITVTWPTAQTNTCWVYADFGSNSWVSLDGITFHDYNVERQHTAAGAAPTGAPLPTPAGVPPRIAG